MAKEPAPSSIRLEPELRDMIDRHIGMRKVLGDKINLSELVREALYAYLPPFEKELKKRTMKALAE